MTLQDIAELEALKNQEFSKGWDKGYEQGKADVIDECIEMLEHDCFLSGTASKVLIHHFEQLKEQK